jgi:hypothetical protein
VLVDQVVAWVWVKVLRKLTSVVWVDYKGGTVIQAGMRTHEFRG